MKKKWNGHFPYLLGGETNPNGVVSSLDFSQSWHLFEVACFVTLPMSQFEAHYGFVL